MDIDISHISLVVLFLFKLQISALMTDVSSSNPKLVLFIGVLFLFPLFSHPLEIPARHLLDYSPPPTTTVTIGDLGWFLAAAHEVPSGANPDSNR
ncbi:unnamed protein product [Lactuca virosa]|uniref:Uncharacterized protein n=1 Tax=Lactuca virosa TaxID=75947 RepID=A0AAU9PR98_9ASTR|nr:unnamed protein product [Lactuca virosa]